MTQRRGGSTILNVLLVVGVMIALWFVAKSIFQLLTFLVPVMLILTLIIDYKVIVNFFKFMGRLFQQNVLYGIGASVLGVIGLPVLSLVLLLQAVFKMKLRKRQKEHDEAIHGKPTEFEILEEEDEPLDLNRVELPEIENEYDELFDEEDSV